MLKRTPLHSVHEQLGAKLIEFGGWDMPVYYTSILDEHKAVRNAAGLFDISHMGEFIVAGEGAEAFLNGILTNDVRSIAAGEGQYTLMCNKQGGVVDDLYTYRMNDSDFLLIVNASRIDADFEWLTRNNAGQARLENSSAQYGALAVQGPAVGPFIDEAFSGPSIGGTAVSKVSDLRKNQIGVFIHDFATVYIARTGYTGEDGFEVVIPAEKVESAWKRLIDVGTPHGLKPCGLGARDTLRTEVCYPLYGHELDEETSPLEAGLGFFVAVDKKQFIGSDVLARQKAEGLAKRCIAFKMSVSSAPPRPGYTLWSTGSEPKVIGSVVSGTQSPSLGIGIGMGYVSPGFSKPGTVIEVEIRARRFRAEVVKKPIYRKPV